MRIAFHLENGEKTRNHFPMKRQREIVESRLAKTKRNLKLCTAKTFQSTSIPQSCVLFRFTNDEDFIEIANTEMGTDFIRQSMKKFRAFVMSETRKTKNEQVEAILHKAPLMKYFASRQEDKAKQEAIRTRALKIALFFMQNHIPVMSPETIRITEIRTHCILCDDSKKYELECDDDNSGLFTFRAGFPYAVTVSANVQHVATILLSLLPFPIVGDILILAGLCCYPDD